MVKNEIYTEIIKEVCRQIPLLFEDFLLKAFLFGSCSKGKVHTGSDIDILIIGKEKKTIELINFISSTMENISIEPEINVIYYELEKFRKSVREGNSFLLSIQKDCIDLEELNELL